MKKKMILMILISLVFTGVMAATSDDKPVTFNELPKQAQQFINHHFKNNKLSYAKQDTDLFDGDYEVMLVNGCKIEFKKNGEWKEVKCSKEGVPTEVIPARIKAYTDSHHQESRVIQIERSSRKYEVKLADGKELEFTLKGNFKRYDY